MVDSSEIDSTVLTLTDNSITLDCNQSCRGHDISRDELERRQLVHTVQLLKLEVSQKQLMLEAVRNEQESQIEELSEKLSDALHEKKLLSLRLQSLTHAYEEESKRMRESAMHTRMGALDRVRTVGPTTVETVDMLRQEMEQGLMSPLITETEYQNIITTTSDLSIQNRIQVRVFELTQQLNSKCANLERCVNNLSQQVSTKQRELEECRQGESQHKDSAAGFEEECERLRQELLKFKEWVPEGNFKIDNYDEIKRERDQLRDQLNEVKQRHSELDVKDKLVQDEMDKLTAELSHSKQTGHLLQQDKEYLERQLANVTHRASNTEERADSLAMELIHAKKDRDSIYEQMLKSRDEHHKEYESRLQRELDTLRTRTTLELDQVRTQSGEISERECRTLREVRDSACVERDNAVLRERETYKNYEQLLREHHNLQTSSEKRVCDLQAKLQMAQFERERVSMVNEETTRQLSERQLEREKLLKKVDLLSQELWHSQSEREAEKRVFETKLEDQRVKLEGYEKVEKDMDDIVMQAAQVEHECDAERVLFSFGFGTALPTTSKRRLQQCVQLARRVLHLEKVNISLQKDFEDQEKQAKNLRKQVSTLDNLLSQSKQPYSYLIETIRGRDLELEACKGVVTRLEGELSALRNDRQKLVNVKNQMSLDLEKLLNHREELQQMRHALSGLLPPHGDHMSTPQDHQDHTLPHNSLGQPPPTLFTKHQPKRSQKTT